MGWQALLGFRLFRNPLNPFEERMKLRYFSIGLGERVVAFNGRNSWRAFIESKSRKEKEMSMWIATKHPAIVFENTDVDRLKKKI